MAKPDCLKILVLMPLNLRVTPSELRKGAWPRETGVERKDILVGINTSSILQYLNLNHTISASVRSTEEPQGPHHHACDSTDHLNHKHPPPNSGITNQGSLKSPKKISTWREWKSRPSQKADIMSNQWQQSATGLKLSNSPVSTIKDAFTQRWEWTLGAWV